MVYTSPYIVVSVFVVVVVVVRHCCIPISRENPELHTYLPPKSMNLAWASTDSPSEQCAVSRVPYFWSSPALRCAHIVLSSVAAWPLMVDLRSELPPGGA